MTYTKITPPAGFVNITDLMTELKTRKAPHKEFLKTYKAKAAFIVPSGRGYAHYVDKDTAEKIRQAFRKQQPIKAISKTHQETPEALTIILQKIEELNLHIDELKKMWK